MSYRYDYVFQNGKRRPKHNVVWEAYSGTSIPNGYVIHHKNGDGHDNRIENLELMTRGDHAALHNHLRKIGMDVVDATNPAVITDRARCKAWASVHSDKIKAASKKYYSKNTSRLSEYHKAYYLNNKEAVKQTVKRRYDERRVDILAQKKEYHKLNREHDNARCLEYRRKHHEDCLANQRQYYAKNRDAIVANKREYNRERRDLINAKMRLHRAITSNKPMDIIAKLKDDVCREQKLFLLKKGGSDAE